MNNVSRRKDEETECIGKVFLPYISEVTERIGGILEKANVKTILKPTKKIKDCLRSVKEERDRSTPNSMHMWNALPTENPVITGVEQEYQIGDEINLNCTSGRSHPASILHWYINEQQISKQDALIPYPEEYHQHGLVSSVLGLKFRLGNHHFRGGSMRVKCVASMTPMLYQTDRESVVQTQTLPLREALLLVKSVSSRTEWSVAVLLFTIVHILLT
ncbi:uncharacterized protein, partial [Diabrotica undecimpunctata]|uniref:uncharacterized protein n=1 Tax=Diabrotica undecimpunctata TaxID=50387 RepID=UPI003B63A9B3